MSKPENPQNNADGTSQAPKPGAESDGSYAPNRQHTARDPYTEAKKFLRKRVLRYVACVVRWLDTHNGLVTAVATGVIAWLTWSIASDSKQQAETANGTLEAIRGQLRAMEREERPWLAIVGPPAIVDPLKIIKDDWATISISFPMKNVGKTPAARVHVASRLIASNEENAKILDWQKTICPITPQKAKLKEGEFFTEYSMPPDALVTANAASTSTFQRKIPRVAGGLADAYFKIVGCILYQFTDSDEKFHATGFIYRIGRMDNRPLYLEIGQQAPIEGIGLFSVPEGNGPIN